MSQNKPDWDPTEPQTVPERIAQMNAVRAGCPVAWAARHGGEWSLLKYEDIVAVTMDPAAFSNAGQARYAKPLPPLEYDPPEHAGYRRLLAPFFAPARIRALEVKVRAAAVDLLAPLIAAGTADLARDYAYPLPVLGLAALLDIPGERWAEIKDWSEHTLLRDSDDPAERAIADEGHEKILAYARTLIADRRRDPRDPADDITATLLAARFDDEALEDEFIAGTLRILISAGHNSTTSALGNTLLFLAQDPAAQARLRADPSLIQTAAEEVLRMDTPVQEMPRWAKAPACLGGREIATGDRLALYWGAANRDPGAFEGADEYRLDRKPSRHLAFGQGIHTCLGAAMARMELRVGVEELLARTRAITLAGEPERAKFHRMGVVSLPVRLEA